MKYFIKYWMDEEETEVNIAALTLWRDMAELNKCEIVLDTVTDTEMHFIEYEI